MMRTLCTLLMLALGAPASFAQGKADTAACQLLRGQLWKPSGTLTLQACADDIGRRGDTQEGSGVRFGFWGQTLLAANKDGRFRSDSGGRDWVALDAGCQKCGRPAPQLSLAGTGLPTGPVALATLAPAAARTPAATRPADEFFQTASSRPQGQVLTTLPAAASAPAAATAGRSLPAPAATASAGLAAVASQALADCELKRSQGWLAQPRQTLAQCLDALARSTAAADANGLQHAYWGGYYLAADRRTIYSSRDGDDWARVRDR